ncbi:outer membrane protein assembly factor BamB family protein [Aporhodopirellula aestuarii]|uniref:PQQ-binding-like beta-propeller repeat protein n=1 Tax=Aporhodopirellula aestuarii TaxID=2950107 RepID=A0ABT0UC93_9BACT|nr:PQQ-binding-like beta-propeller repeat protein [Aporhodopirellula aestuarii]MCM2374638.1 PQQ-binding-like beta-propeller repeat protein [Aporhodopirellula aestuarii]
MKTLTVKLSVLFACAFTLTSSAHAQSTTDWPSFRGPRARGVSEGGSIPTTWNADTENGPTQGMLWDTEVPGLGHSSPIIQGDRIFLLTAVADKGDLELNIAAGGNIDAAEDDGSQSWIVLCYDKTTGKEIWRQTAHQGMPRATRHSKATHANTSVAVSGNRLVACFGSEGVYCYDLDGNLIWKRDLGVIDVSKYGIGWGYASSPVIHGDRVALICDDPDHPFVTVLRLADGEEVWKVDRADECERSWGTPLVYESDGVTQMIVNGWPWIVSYHFETGEEIWRLEGGGDNPIPTPFVANGWIYITNAHGGKAPIYVVRPDARGTLSLDEEEPSEAIVWNTERGGSYMSTPVVSGDYLYLGNSNGVVRCFHAKTGEKMFEKRLGKDAGIIASLVAVDGNVLCASENATVYVLATGPEYELVAENPVGEPCFATPAISDGVLYLRTTKRLIAIGNSEPTN